MPSISAQFTLLTLHLEVAWVYTRYQLRILNDNGHLGQHSATLLSICNLITISS
ncbi:hypothetical protein [Psychromonas sp. Urea-02u-13]|uniref:hypothetical protein n=1 Tax=Psychromonas sp. Urea-02u-13 TaxID=2058326 RepID=UPI0012FEFA9F|nr:hypothetical protein [Psychromonas sp. Urea-02u-13]